MCSVPRVEDDDDLAFVWEGIGPSIGVASAERRGIQRFMQRVVRDILANEADYGSIRDPLILLAENYARTCHSYEEFGRRLASDGKEESLRGTAARLLARIWEAERASEAA